jgi:hypothetical protein
VSFPSNTTPLFDAVVHALTRHTGQPDCLSPDRLFTLGRPADLTIAPSPSAVLSPRCFVAPIAERVLEPRLRMSNRERIEATVSIRCWYYAHDLYSTQWRETMARIADDRRRLPAALTYCDALYTAPDGTRTGLDGGSLAPDRWESIGPEPERGQPRVYRVLYTFRANVELARPT